MLRPCSTLLLTLAASLLALVTIQVDGVQASYLKQADKRSVIARLKWQERRDRYNILRPRASVTPCRGVVDPDGTCCLGVLVGDNDDECCPTPQIVFIDSCGTNQCCAPGAVGTVPVVDPADSANETQCCFGTIYQPATGSEACCPPGGQLTEDGQQCCAQGTTPVGNSCVAGGRKLAKRVVSADGHYDRPPIDLVPGRTATLLSAEQVAEFLLRNGIFAHEGETYIDHSHRKANENLFHKLVGRGMTVGMRFASRTGVSAAHIPEDVLYYHLSSHYEFAVADIPEIYARLVADPDFEDFHWRGASFDKDTLYRLASPHPNFNETLVEQYARDFEFQGRRWRV